MKMKRRNVVIGTLSAMALATVSLATVGMSKSVVADAAAVEYGTDASKWTNLHQVTVDSTKGLVPTTAAATDYSFKAVTTEVGGNSSAEIVTDFHEDPNIWGVMIYYFKWNEGKDSVLFSWDTAGTWDYPVEYNYADPANPVPISGIRASNPMGDWGAVVVSTFSVPFVIECNNGVLSTSTAELWKNGFNGNDYWQLFSQKSAVKIDITDTATGISVDVGYDNLDGGVSGYTGIVPGDGKYTSSNTNLRGEGSFAVTRMWGGATFASGNSTISVKVDDVASEYTAGSGTEEPSEPLSENDWAGDSSKWQKLHNVNVNPSKGIVPSAISGADFTFKAITKEITAPTTMAEITTNFKEGTGLWGVMIYYIKWNEGTDSVTWSWGTNPQYPLEGVGSSTALGLTASNVAGDWIALAISHASPPLVIECKDGQMVKYEDNRIWAAGFGVDDFGYFYNQKTIVKFAIADTATGITFKVTYDGVGTGVGETGLNTIDGFYTSDNPNLKGAGAIAITRALGNATFSTGASTINAVFELKEADKLGTPVVSVNETGVVTWTAVENASGYAYKVGEDGEELPVSGNFVQMKSGETVYVKAVGDAINYADGDWSTGVSFTASKLATPAVEMDGNVATWGAVSGAVGYKYKIDDGEEMEISGTSVELLHGQTIVVMAIGDNETGLDSNWSNSISYSAPKLATLTLTANYGDGTVTWTALSGAVKYEYKFGENGTVKETEEPYLKAEGTTIVYVRAVGDQKAYANGDWASVNYHAPALTVPSIVLSGNEASWTKQANAIGYVCKINGNEQEMITDNYVLLANGDTLQVKAVGDGVRGTDSDWSNVLTYKAKALDVPYAEFNGNVLQWEAIDGAIGYVCEVNGEAQEIVYTCSYVAKHGDTIKVKAVGNGTTTVDSDYSEEVTYEAEALATPVVTTDANGARWDAILGAQKYLYKINGGAAKETTKTAVDLAHGQTIVVMAVGDGVSNTDSVWSSAVSYQAPALNKPVITLSGNVASWEAVAGALSYTYKIGETGAEQTMGGTSVILTHSQVLYVKAVGNGATSLDSDWASVSYQAPKLAKVVVSLNANVATWDVVNGATGYAYQINGGEVKTTSANAVALKHGEEIVVKALGDNENTQDGDWSTKVKFTAAKLAAPTVELNGALATWEAVAGAVSYQYKIGENGTVTTTNDCFVGLENGDTLYVKAIGDNETALNSDWSVAVTYDETANEPNDEPSDEPSDTPTDEPSDEPTDEPSDTPSVEKPQYTQEQVAEMIDALPTELEGEELYKKKASYTRTYANYLKAKEAFYALTQAEQKAIVGGEEKLDALKETLDDFKTKLDKAEAVDTLIFAIPMSAITKDNYDARKTQIDKAKAAYAALSAEEKEFSQMYGYLCDREAQLASYTGEEDKKGCKSSLGGVAIVGLVLGGVALIKRKKDEE